MKMKRIIIKCIHGIWFLIIMTFFFLSFPLAFIVYEKKRYWLVSEVDFDARDNGIHFFRYLNEKHKEINSIYLISKKNPYYESVKNIGNVIEPLTFKHMLVFIAARAKISTCVHGCSPNSYVTLYLCKFHSTGKNIALKHGIFKNLHPNYFKKNAHLDLICCGGKPEFDFINECFGYQNGVAQYTGLARFDNLHNFITDNEILIMPTWRRWLDPIKSDEEFQQTEFYKKWIGLLKSISTNDFLNDKHIKISFFLHPKLNRFYNVIKCSCPNVSFFSSTSGDNVQSRLKSASLLITDFSSIYFDFAYMKKPSLYFQFDEDQYFGKHYIKAYFDYRENGFGPVFTDSSLLIKDVIRIAKNNFKIDDVYKKRCDDFYVKYDSLNCERIFAEITKIV